MKVRCVGADLIVPDTRLNKYKEELDKAGFTYTVTPFKVLKGGYKITVDMDKKNVSDLTKVLKNIQFYYKTKTN